MILTLDDKVFIGFASINALMSVLLKICMRNNNLAETISVYFCFDAQNIITVVEDYL